MEEEKKELTPDKQSKKSSQDDEKTLWNSHRKKVVKKAKLSLQKRDGEKRVARVLINLQVDLNETEEFKDSGVQARPSNKSLEKKVKSKTTKVKKDKPSSTRRKTSPAKDAKVDDADSGKNIDSKGVDDEAPGEQNVQSPPKIRTCPTCKCDMLNDVFKAHIKDCLQQFMKTAAEKRASVMVALEEKSKTRELQREQALYGDDVTSGDQYLCQLCQKDLSHMNSVRRSEHVNKCIDQTENKSSESDNRPPPPVKTAVLDCPMCGKGLKTEASRKTHLKKCARTLNVTTEQMMQAVRAQEQDHRQNTGTEQQHRPAGTSAPKRVQTTKSTKRKAKGPQDEATQLAMALSSSLADEERKKEQHLIGQLNLRGISDIAGPEAKEGKRKRKKNAQSGPAPLLLQLSKTEAQNRIAERVTQLMLPPKSTVVTMPVTRQPSSRDRDSRLTDLTGTKVFTWSGDASRPPDMLWTRTSLEKEEVNCDVSVLFYTGALIPPVTVCRTPVHSRFRRLSQIPGRRKSADTESSQEKASPAESTPVDPSPVIVSTQTAVVFAELEEEQNMDVDQQGENSGNEDYVHDIGTGVTEIKGCDHGDEIEEMNVSTMSTESSHKGDAGSDEASGFCEITDPVPNEDTIHEASGFCPAKPIQHEEKSSLSPIQRDYLSLVDNPQHSDVTIETKENSPICAHAVILAVRCPCLLQERRGRVISLADCSYGAVMSMLKFVYAGVNSLQTSHVQEVLRLAERFNLPELLDICKSMPISIDTEAEPAVDQQDCANRERKKSIDSLFKEMFSDSDEDESEKGKENVESEKVNDSDEDEDDWREIYCSQRVMLHRQKSVGNDDEEIDDAVNPDDSNQSSPTLKCKEKSVTKVGIERKGEDSNFDRFSQDFKNKVREKKDCSPEKNTTNSDEDPHIIIVEEEGDLSVHQADVNKIRNLRTPQKTDKLPKDMKESGTLSSSDVIEYAVIRRNGRSPLYDRDRSANNNSEVTPSKSRSEEDSKVTPSKDKRTSKLKTHKTENVQSTIPGTVNERNTVPSKHIGVKSSVFDTNVNSPARFTDTRELGTAVKYQGNSNSPVRNKLLKDVQSTDYNTVEEGTCGEDELFSDGDDDDLVLALTSVDSSEDMDVGQESSHVPTFGTHANAESSECGKSARPRNSKDEKDSKSNVPDKGNKCDDSDENGHVEIVSPVKTKGHSQSSEEFQIVKSGTSTSVSSEESLSKSNSADISNEILPDSPGVTSKIRLSRIVGESSRIGHESSKAGPDSTRAAEEAPRLESRKRKVHDISDSPVIQKWANRPETPATRCASKRVRLSTPGHDSSARNPSKASTPLDRLSKPQHSIVEQDSLYITPIPKERTRSTFMLVTPDCVTGNRRTGDYCATPVGQVVEDLQGREVIIGLESSGVQESRSKEQVEKNRKRDLIQQRHALPSTDVSRLSETASRERLDSNKDFRKKRIASEVSHLSETVSKSRIMEDDSSTVEKRQDQATSDDEIVGKKDSDSDIEITGDNLSEISTSPKFQGKKLSRISSERKKSGNKSLRRSLTPNVAAAEQDSGNEAPCVQSEESNMDDVWEGLDEMEAGCQIEPFCDADTEESPQKQCRTSQGSSQKKRYSHHKRPSNDSSGGSVAMETVDTPSRRLSFNTSQQQHQDEDDLLPSPERVSPREVTMEFDVPGDSFLWKDDAFEEDVNTNALEVESVYPQKDTFKTPVSNLPRNKPAKKWVPPSPFTPMPNYDQMNTPQLKKEVSKFGVRPVGKKRMKTLLKDIYTKTHEYETDSDYDQSPQKASAGVKNETKNVTSPKKVEKQTSQNVKTKKSAKQTSPKKTSKPAERTKTATITSAAATGYSVTSMSDASEDGSSQKSFTSSQESGASDIPEESMLIEDDDEISASQQISAGDLHAQLMQFVKDRPELHTQVLLYEPLELDWLRDEIKAAGIKCSMQKLMDFLDEKCITFTMKKMTKRNQNRRQRKKKKLPKIPAAAV